MSKIFDVEKMYGQDFSIVTTNAPSNIIRNSEINLLPNIMLVSSPSDESETNDNNLPSLFVTDYNANPLQLTYPLYMKDGLSLSEKFGYAYINIDRKTISTIGNDGTGPLYVNTNNLTKASVEEYGVVKIADELGLERGNYKIGTIELPNESFIDVNEEGVIYLSNSFFEWVGNVINQQVKEKVDNIKLILNNNLRIWIEIIDTNIMNLGSIYNLNTSNSSIDISNNIITSLTFNLKYLSFYNDSENVKFTDISEHNIYKIEYNGSNISNQNILTVVEEYNDDLFLHSIDNISLSFLPNYYIDEYSLNNNEEYNLSIEFMNNSSHPTEKITFKQPQLFDTSDQSKFNLSLNKDIISIQDTINRGYDISLQENINNAVFDYIKDNGIDIVKYYIYTYVDFNNVKYPLIDKQEYILNNNYIPIDSNNIHNIVDLIMLYLETTENSDRYNVIQNQNLIDTSDNFINIICEFIININNREYTYSNINKLKLILMKSIEYGLFIDKQTPTHNNNNIALYYIKNANNNLVSLVGLSPDNITEQLDSYVSSSKLIGVIDTDLKIVNNNIVYILEIENFYNYKLQNDNFILETYDDSNGRFSIKESDIDDLIHPSYNSEINQIILTADNSVQQNEFNNSSSKVIKGLINGIELETQYGSDSSIINNKLYIYLDILDIIIQNINITLESNTTNRLSTYYNRNTKVERYSTLFNQYYAENINTNSFKTIQIKIPEYIKYLLNLTQLSNSENYINKFGILIKYNYQNNKTNEYHIEMYSNGEEFVIDNKTDKNGWNIFSSEISGDTIIISGMINETAIMPEILGFLFIVQNVSIETGEYNDNYFIKQFNFMQATENIYWPGFVAISIQNDNG